MRGLFHLAAHSTASSARVLLLHLVESAVALGNGQVGDLGVRLFHQVVGSEGADELSEDSQESGADCGKDQDTSGDAPLDVSTLFATVMVAMTSSSTVFVFVGTMFAAKLLSFSTMLFVLALVIIVLALKNAIGLAFITSPQMTTTVTLVNRGLRDVRKVQSSLNIFKESREELFISGVRVIATSLLFLVLLHHLLGSLLGLLVGFFGCFLVRLSHLLADD